MFVVVDCLYVLILVQISVLVSVDCEVVILVMQGQVLIDLCEYGGCLVLNVMVLVVVLGVWCDEQVWVVLQIEGCLLELWWLVGSYEVVFCSDLMLFWYWDMVCCQFFGELLLMIEQLIEDGWCGVLLLWIVVEFIMCYVLILWLLEVLCDGYLSVFIVCFECICNCEVMCLVVLVVIVLGMLVVLGVVLCIVYLQILWLLLQVQKQVIQIVLEVFGLEQYVIYLLVEMQCLFDVIEVLCEKLCECLVLISELCQLVGIDELIGLLNWCVLDQRVQQCYVDGGNSVVVILFDVDCFKVINDGYGYVVGDQVLVQVVQLLQCYLCCSDSIVCYGGEEFLVLLVDGDLVGGCQLVELLCVVMWQLDIVLVGGNVLWVIVSFGVVEGGIDVLGWCILLCVVDVVMYQVKVQGCDCVWVVGGGCNVC